MRTKYLLDGWRCTGCKVSVHSLDLVMVNRKPKEKKLKCFDDLEFAVLARLIIGAVLSGDDERHLGDLETFGGESRARGII